MPTGNMQLEMPALYFYDNGKFTKVCDIAECDDVVTETYNGSYPVWVQEPICGRFTARFSWCKNNHLALYGKNRRIRKKNKKIATIEYMKFLTGCRMLDKDIIAVYNDFAATQKGRYYE